MVRKYTILIVFLILLLIAISVYASPSENKIKKDKSIEIKENKIIEKEGQGKIIFKENFNLEIEEVEENPNLFIGEDKIAVAVNEPNTETENNILTIKTIYSDAYPVIAINTEELPELKKSATLIFENLPYDKTPKILYSSKYTTNLSEFTQFCPDDVCTNINYNKETGTLIFDVDGFSSFVPVSPDCIEVPVERIAEIRNKVFSRINALRFPGGVWLSPGQGRVIALPTSGTVLDVRHVTDLRNFIMQGEGNYKGGLIHYFWNLDRVGDGSKIKNYPYSLTESNEPAKYSATLNELFQQALGQDTWTNPAPTCITEKDLEELEKIISKLEWIFMALPNIARQSELGYSPPVAVEWYRVKTAAGNDPDLAKSWEKTKTDFDSNPGYLTSPADYCAVYDVGIGRWDDYSKTYLTQLKHDKCSVLFDFSKGNPNVGAPFVKRAKAYFSISPSVTASGRMEGDYTISNVHGQLIMGGDIFDIKKGYNLFDIKINEDKLYTFEIDPSGGPYTPDVLKDNIRYGEGFEGGFYGIFISPYKQENAPPAVEVKFGPEKQNSCSSTESSDNNEITVCDSLKCTAEISDPDIADTEFTAEFKITGGSGSLSKSIPELKETGACSGNSCEVSFTIAKEYTNFEDEIICSVIPSDGKINGKEESASLNIKPKCEVV